MTFNTSHILSISFILHKYTSILECFLDVLLFGQFQTCSIRYKRLLGYLFIYGSVSPGRELCPFFLKKVRAYCGKTVRYSFVFSSVSEILVLVGPRRRRKKMFKVFLGGKKAFLFGGQILIYTSNKKASFTPKTLLYKKIFSFFRTQI